jgi:hypothetical protein
VKVLETGSSTRPWLWPERLGTDVLRLADGSLRAVLECTSPTGRLGDAIAALWATPHPVQVVVRSRRAVAEGASQLARLRASYAEMVARLNGEPQPLTERLLVVVPWDVGDGESGQVVLNARVRSVGDRLERMGVEPTRLKANELDALTTWDDAEEHRCAVRMGDRWARTLLISCHPERLDAAWFRLLCFEHDLAVQLRRFSASRAEASIVLTVWADSLEVLNRATTQAEEILSAHGVKSRRPHLQAEPALATGLPLCLDWALAPAVRLRARPAIRPILPGAQDEPREFVYGVDPGSQRQLGFDRFALENPNTIILGDDSGGSRLLVHLELLRSRLFGTPAFVIDPEGDHAHLVAAVGGAVVGPTLDARTPFDPFSLNSKQDSLAARIQVLSALVELLARDLPATVRPILEDALAFSYAAWGFTDEADHAERTPPCLGDVVLALERRALRIGGVRRAEIEAVVHGLDRYVRGDGRRLFERPAVGLSERAPITAYALAGLPAEDRPAAILLSLDQVWKSLSGERRALVVVAGIDPLLPHEMATRLAAQLMDKAASRRAGLTLVASNVVGILEGALRQSVLNAGVKLLLRQTPDAASRLAEVFQLTPVEQSWLVRAPAGEGLLLTEGGRLAFKSVASDEERRLIPEGGHDDRP